MIPLILGLSLFLLCSSTTNTMANGQQPESSLTKLQDLGRYVGEYPCLNGLLKAPVLNAALRKTLGSEYNAYAEHMTFSGCGAIVRNGPYLLLDVSQLHVGGYTSIILVRESDGVLFLAWLKGTVVGRDITIYGPKPIPQSVLDTFARTLNVAWGHVACFRPEGDSLSVDTDRRADQDTGQCLPLDR